MVKLHEVLIMAILNLTPTGASTHKPTVNQMPTWYPKPVKLIAQTPMQAPQPLPDLQPVSMPPPAPSAPTVVSGCGDNSMANYIYMHESGCSTTITNSSGCLGIGQACPASKLTAVCPNLDYACENNFFTAYANSAYGGWAGAYNHWLAYSWW